MDTVAIIGSGIMAKNLALHARKINVKTICFSFDPNDVAVKYVDEFFEIDIFKKEKILEICKRIGIGGVLPTTELTIPVAAYISEELGLNGNSLYTMEHITSKNWVRDHLRDAKHIKQPKYAHLFSKDELSAISEMRLPLIIKPVAEGGKRGINVAHTEAELHEYLNVAFSADRSENGVIVEEYIPTGMECSVELLSYHGNHQVIQVTQNICGGAPHCVELGHSQPADVSSSMRKKIELAMEELLNKTGFVNGASCCEIKIYKNEVYLIELNSRLGGDGIAYPLTVLSTDYDYLAEVIRVALDEEPRPRGPKTHERYSGMRFVVQQTEYLKPLFDTCDSAPWLYEKNYVTDELIDMTHNDMEHINYFIYVSDEKPVFKGEEKYNNF